jgi:CRP-like cAMP-binding protein
MQIVAESNIKLLDKLTHMSKKSTRDKLLSYLTSMSEKAGSEYFEIPFNKTELANYLSVDRSAMSTELGKMRDEGIVDFDKKRYRLIKSKLRK